jgi:hypothetical protein
LAQIHNRLREEDSICPLSLDTRIFTFNPRRDRVFRNDAGIFIVKFFNRNGDSTVNFLHNKSEFSTSPRPWSSLGIY